MKKLPAAMFVALLMVGCFKEIEDGPFMVYYKDGQKKMEGNFKDGKPVGLFTAWYENRQKEYEENFKDGKLMSAVVWKPNGEKCPVTNLKDGNGIMVSYNDDGTERGRFPYNDGEEVRD